LTGTCCGPDDCPCSVTVEFGIPNAGGGSPVCGDNPIYGEATISRPECIAQEGDVGVRVTGSVDDDLLINGEVIQEGKFPFGNTCNGAHIVTHQFVLSEPTFTIAVRDNHGGGTGYGLTFCFGTPSYCCLSITSCFGSGASGYYETDGGGPITSATVNQPGSGYAKIGRREPTLAVANAYNVLPIAGSSAWITLTQDPGSCDRTYWVISAVTIPRDAPIVQLALVRPGYDVPTQQIPDRNKLRITLDGNNYEESPAGQEVAADVRLNIVRVQPTLTLSVQSFYGGGVGAVLTATLAQGVYLGKTIWSVSAIAITNPGSGYEAPGPDQFEPGDGPFYKSDQVFVSPAAGARETGANDFLGWVASVDENGGITALTIYSGGAYYNVEIDSVTVVNGGRFYKEDASLPPIVSPITVKACNPQGGTGSGAVIEATVDDDPESETFGQVTGFVVVEGGDGYSENCGSNPLP
jgi:hypothetical protein